MESDQFEQLVRAAIEKIPARFRARMENVAFVVETNERAARPAELQIQRGGRLLGLYQGVPYGRRGPSYSGVLPDKITLFQDTIEDVAGNDLNRIAEIVSDTVAHEIAHYFGMNEMEVRRWERTKKRK